jgi:hypothetical protein
VVCCSISVAEGAIEPFPYLGSQVGLEEALKIWCGDERSK